jgi:glutathione S-transferase
MILYFAPLACSMASRIALHEAGLAADFREVVLSTKALKAGGDFRDVNAKGQVPALELDDGRIVTEGPAVLQTIADMASPGVLAPASGTPERTELQSWLNMIASGLHSGGFYPQMHPASPPEARAFARMRIADSFDHFERHLTGRTYLMDSFTVADAYLVTALGWCEPVGIDLGRWPALLAYRFQLRERPSVARALSEELALRAAA